MPPHDCWLAIFDADDFTRNAQSLDLHPEAQKTVTLSQLRQSHHNFNYVFLSTFYLCPGGVRCIIGRVSNGQSVVFQAAIKAQRCNPCFVVLLKVAELHLFFCPSADCAILFGARDPTERRLAEAQD
jgi:hypothetical protein